MFKVGDKVRCIDADHSNYCITLGKIYEVRRVVPKYIGIVDDKDLGVRSWYSSRFELVEEKKEEVKMDIITDQERADRIRAAVKTLMDEVRAGREENKLEIVINSGYSGDIYSATIKKLMEF